MKEYPVVRLPLVLLAGLVAFGLSHASIARGGNAPQAAAAGTGMSAAAGTYSGALPLGGGLTFRGLVTLHADGTITGQDASDFGSVTLAGAGDPYINSVAFGSWRHTTGRSFVATLIFFRVPVGGAGEVDSLGRLTLTGTFDEGFHTGSIDAIVETFPCVPATIGCPEPALLPPPAAPVLGTFSLNRILP